MLCALMLCTTQAYAEESARDQARHQFELGFAAQARGDCKAALASFLRSRALYATRNATNNAAVCMLRLGRAPDALGMFEALLREFPDLAAQDKRAAQYEIQQLREVVGSLDVRRAPVGAQLVVDGRNRGEVPLLNPIHLRSGSHLVSVYLEGYAPFSQRVEVAGGEHVQLRAPLAALEGSEWLRITEALDRHFEVVVDGIVMGKTPWRGRVGLGPHTVLLRGPNKLGSEPVRVEVIEGRTNAVRLVTKTLTAIATVHARPRGARIYIDAVEVGQGLWRGRLSAGTHRFESAAPGFEAQSRRTTMTRGDNQVRFRLKRDPESSLWQRPSRIVVDALLAPALAPSFGGDVAGGCSQGCDAAAPFGFTVQGFVGYELGSGLSFGAWAGYLSLTQQLADRPLQLLPVGLRPRSGVATETLRLQGGLTGAIMGYHRTGSPSFHARMAIGALIADVGNLRRSVFAANGGDFAAPDVASATLSPFIAVAPDLRATLAISDSFELGLGVNLLMLFPTDRPRWGDDGNHPVTHPDDGFSVFGSEALVGPALLVISPGLTLRYAR